MNVEAGARKSSEVGWCDFEKLLRVFRLERGGGRSCSGEMLRVVREEASSESDERNPVKCRCRASRLVGAVAGL